MSATEKIKTIQVMNELEKTTPQQEDAIPTNGETPEVNTVEETEATIAPAVAEAESVEAGEQTISTEEDDARMTDWHSKSKEELAAALREIVEQAQMNRHKDVAAIKQAFHALRTKELDRQMAEFIEAGNSPEAFAALPDETEYEFKELLSRFKEGRAEYLAAEEARLAANLESRRTIIASMRDVVEDIDNINLHFPRFQQLQADFKEIKDVTPGADNEVWKEYQAVVELFYDRLKMNKELRDLDFRKNMEAKQELIESARKLAEEADVIAAFRQLQELHAKWREIGPVAKENREQIWADFSEASTVVNKRHQQHFEQRKQAEKANEEAKTALCEEIEAIDLENMDSFNKWESATKSVLDMQARWKKLGFASKKVNNELFARFRRQCDAFFAAKAEYYRRVKEDLAANLEKKIALCEKVEAILAGEDRNSAAEKVIALQNEWKTIGGVARRQSDAVWQRFTTACNKFFEERKQRHSSARKVENENMAAKRALIDRLKEIKPEEAPRNETIPVVREIQEQWQKIGHVPYKMKDRLYEEYREQCDRIYDYYAASGARKRMNGFAGKIEKMNAGDGQLDRERERLYRAYEQKRAELKTFENNMGFFNVKSSDGNSMVREMERRIAKIKEELTELKRKIELIDEKMD